MFDNTLIFLSFSLTGVALGWLSCGDEEPLPPLTEPTLWENHAAKAPILKFSVSASPNKMYEVITQEGQETLFFDDPDNKLGSSVLKWDIGEYNDIPRVTFKTRLVPPRKVEYEMTIHAKNLQQFEALRIPEKEMYGYLLEANLARNRL